MLLEGLYKEKIWLQCLTIFTIMALSSLFYRTACSNSTSICVTLLFQPVIGVSLLNELFNCFIMGSGSHSHRKIIWVTKWRKNHFVLFLYHLQFILSQCTAEYIFSCNLEKEYWKQVPACQVKFCVTSLSGAILLKCSTL